MSRLYRHVAAQIATAIDTGEFRAGDRLPAERDLSTRIRVSRPTVREAIVALEIAGRVEVRAGSGVYVTGALSAHGVAAALADTIGASPLDVVNARLDIECAIVGHAAHNATDAQLDAILDTVTLMRRAAGRRQFEAADRDFHVAIADATGNSVLAPIVGSLWAEMSSPIFARLSFISGLSRGTESWAIDDHRAVHAALAGRDAPGAEAAMRAHLEHVRAFLQRDWRENDTMALSLDAVH